MAPAPAHAKPPHPRLHHGRLQLCLQSPPPPSPTAIVTSINYQNDHVSPLLLNLTNASPYSQDTGQGQYTKLSATWPLPPRSVSGMKFAFFQFLSYYSTLPLLPTSVLPECVLPFTTLTSALAVPRTDHLSAPPSLPCTSLRGAPTRPARPSPGGICCVKPELLS